MWSRWQASLLALAFSGIPQQASAQIGTDQGGRVYFIDPYRHVLWRVDQAGKRDQLLSGVSARYLAVRSDGTVYLPHDTFTRTFGWRVTIVAPSGAARDTVLTTDIAVDSGRTVGVDSAGIYFQRGGELTQVSFDGRLRTRLYHLGQAQVTAVAPTIMNRVEAITGNMIQLSEADTLGPDVIGDSLPGLVDLSRTSARFNHPSSIAVDDRGTMYLADQGNRRVRKVTYNGDASTLLHSWWPWRPVAVTINAETVYVLEQAPLLRMTRLRRVPR